MRDKLLHVRNTEPGQPLQLEDGEWDGLTFRKELIYADDFHKRNATSDQKFTIDEMKLAHWEHVGNQMIADGVKVPTPLKHTDSPEANRGQIIRYERGTNSKGVPALYGVVKFRDAEAAKLANSTDISIFVPETPFYNGKGKKYEYGIRHVALTDYPVIPGLEGFIPIAASFDEFDSEPLELGIGSVLKNNSNRLLGTQIAGETVGETAHTKGQHKAAAGLLGASAYFGGKEVKRIAGRFGKTAMRQYKKGGIGRVARSLGQFNQVTQIKPAAKTAGVISKVARAVGRRIPLVGLASAAAGIGFGAGAVKSGIEGAAYHASKIKNAPNKKRHTLSLEFKQMVQRLKQDLQLDFGQPERLELGGPGSGPQKGGLIKHNGLESRSVFDRIRMNVGKVKPHLQKIGKASASIAKNVAKSPITHIAVGSEIANQAAKKIRGDDEDRRVAGYLTSRLGLGAVKSAVAANAQNAKVSQYEQFAKQARNLKEFQHGKQMAFNYRAARTLLGAKGLVSGGLAAIAAKSLLKKKEVKASNDLELGGPGSGPNVGQSRGTYRTAKKRINITGKRIGRLLGRVGVEVDKSAGRFGAHAGATIGRVVGEQGAIATSRLARMAAPTVVRGEGVNYLTKKIRGDDENRRAVSYVAQGAGMSALKSAGRNRKVAAAVAALTGASLFLRKQKKQELSLGGPGSGPQKQSGASDAEVNHFKKAHRYSLASIIAPAATRYAFGKIMKNKKLGFYPAMAVGAAGVGATGYTGYKSAKHSLAGLKERYKRKRSLLPDGALSLNIIDEHGNIHARDSGRFVAKMDKDRSARSQRRNLTSLKPKKYHYEDIGPVPARESDEAPREYKLRIRKLRNENKVENPNYYKDFSEEDVKSNPVASTHQGIKHAALTTVAATGAVGATAGAYAAGKSLVKEVQSQASRMQKKTNWKAKAAKANKALGAKRGALTRASKAGEAKVISAAKKSVLSAEAKATAMKILAEGANTKARTKVQLGKSILKAAHRILKNKNTKWRLLGVAAATAAAATAAHETKQHYDATQYHLGNVAKTLSDFKNSGLIKRK